ncbi:prepilin peptidase [Vibrio aestuarianus]
MLSSCIVSFYQLCVFRYKLGFDWKRILLEPSSCEFCSCKIQCVYLIPIFGFILSKGRCIYCNEKISVKYFVSETVTFSMLVLIVLFLIK